MDKESVYDVYNAELCVRCKGRGWCGKPCIILQKFRESMPKPKTHFSGSSPPEIFVGRNDYPVVNAGILAPQHYGKTEEYGMPELWFEKKLSIEQILSYRGNLIYSRFKTRVKDARQDKKFLSVMQEISLASKPVASEFWLKKPAKFSISPLPQLPVIGNPAPLKYVRLEENPKVERKVDYLVSDTDNKAAESIKELYKSKVEVSNIIKLLSAGLLGLKTKRKLVPTRWSVTATDDIISKDLLEKIRYYKEISEIMVFHSEYIGNHYEFLLLPEFFSFEVIEAKIPGSVWNPSGNLYFAIDYEGFGGRKDYASNVTGAYYVNRLALCEYLERIKRQAACLVIRECRPEYYAPCGVGVLREVSRDAFKKKPEIFSTIEDAFKSMQERLTLPVSFFKEKSWLLKIYKKQRRLSEFG